MKAQKPIILESPKVKFLEVKVSYFLTEKMFFNNYFIVLQMIHNKGRMEWIMNPCFYCLMFFASLYSNAQSSDTVYIQQEPLIMRKQIIVEVAENTSTPLVSFFTTLGLGYGSYVSKQFNDSIHKSLTSIYAPVIQLGVIYKKNISFSIGLGRSYANLNMQYEQGLTKTTENITIKYDTIGEFVVEDPSGPITKYSIDSIAYIEQRVNHYDSTVNIKNKLNFWTIPLLLSYSIRYKKYYISPSIGMNLHIGSFSKVVVSNYRQISISQSYLSASFGLDIGVQIYSKLSLEVGGRYLQQMTHKENYIRLNQFATQFQLKYIF